MDIITDISRIYTLFKSKFEATTDLIMLYIVIMIFLNCALFSLYIVMFLCFQSIGYCV